MSMILNLLSLMLVSTNDFKNETVLRLQLYNLPANTNFYRILLYHRVSLSLKSRETSLRLTLKYSFFRKLFNRLSLESFFLEYSDFNHLIFLKISMTFSMTFLRHFL